MKSYFAANLPKLPVKLVAITGENLPLQQALSAIGMKLLFIKPAAFLPVPVRSHPDMLLQHLGENKILLASHGLCDEALLHSAGFEVSVLKQKPGNRYPNDIALNFAVVGQYVFGNIPFAAPELIECYQEQKKELVFTRQGYAHCSCCILNESSIVTEDPSLAAAAKKVGLTVLQVPGGEIFLEGYSCGFLGGCCGLLGKHRLAFFGNAKQLSYYRQFYRFLEEQSIELLCLCPEIPPTDVGGILPLLQSNT